MIEVMDSSGMHVYSCSLDDPWRRFPYICYDRMMRSGAGRERVMCVK